MTDQQRFFVIWLRTFTVIAIICIAGMVMCERYGEAELIEYTPISPK